jgi:hypothetical protein
MSYLGWRLWRLGADGILTGLHARAAKWPGPHVRATAYPECMECGYLYPDFERAFLERDAGIYAWRLPTEGNPSLPLVDRVSLNLIGGQVELFGSVAIHEHGYRATEAMIRSLTLCGCGLCLVRGARENAIYLADRYQCEVFLHTETSCGCPFCVPHPLEATV